MHRRFRNNLHRSRVGLRHRLTAKSTKGGGIHSPFLFRFITTVIGGRWPYYAFRELEAIADQIQMKPQKAHSLLAHTKSKRDEAAAIGRMLFRIVQDLRPDVMVEVGGTDGLDTLHLVKSCPAAICWCLTDNPGTISETLRQNGASSVNVRLVRSGQDIRTILQESGRPGLVFFNRFGGEGNRLQAFQACLERREEHTIFLFRHIHETPEQTQTWNVLKSRPEVRVSIDLFRLGILFFRPEWPRTHYKIKTKFI